jgi:hypothetical protein
MDKKEAKQLTSEVRKIINEWDFLSAAALGVKDEYDCIVGPLTSLLVKGASRDILRNSVERELKNHFGSIGAYSKDSLEKTLDKLMVLQKSLGKYTYDQIPSIFVEHIPEFERSEEYKYVDWRIPYTVMGGFAKFFVKYIEAAQDPLCDGLINRVFALVNELYDPANSLDEAINIIHIEIFENLTSSGKGIKLAYKLLKDYPLQGFVACRRDFGLSDKEIASIRI